MTVLKIRRMARYSAARYPRGPYKPNQPGTVESLAKRGGATLLLLALYEACGDSGVTGPPPVMPDMVTESEARQIITGVFDRNGIDLEEDYRLVFQMGPGDSVVLDVDGFNDSLLVGYEYVVPDDRSTFNDEVRDSLRQAANNTGPYIKTLEAMDKYPGDDSYIRRLETQIEAFVDTLKAHGVI
jgi:hypothetical protein